MRHAGVSFATFVGLLASVAHADPKPADPKLTQADKLFAEGRALMDQKRPGDACVKFSQAVELDPTAAGTMLNLGLCNEAQQKYKTALYWFRRAQVRASETGLAPFEQAAKEHTATLSALVATIAIAITEPSPPDVTVTIDGETVPSSDFARIEIDPGKHTLEGRAADRKTIRQDFTVDGRGGQTLSLEFKPGSDTELVDVGRARRRYGVITAIGGGVLIVVAGAVGLHEHSAELSLPHDPTMGSVEEICGYSAANSASCNHRHNIAEVWGDTLFGVGAAAVAVGAIVYLTAPEKQRVSTTAIAPMVGADHVGVALSGRF
jgi:hypothetical protein